MSENIPFEEILNDLRRDVYSINKSIGKTIEADSSLIFTYCQVQDLLDEAAPR